MLRVGDLDRSIKFYTGGAGGLRVLRDVPRALRALDLFPCVISRCVHVCHLEPPAAGAGPCRCIPPVPLDPCPAAAPNPCLWPLAPTALAHAEVLGMKLLRTRDNPEYKYTLAFLGGYTPPSCCCPLLLACSASLLLRSAAC